MTDTPPARQQRDDEAAMDEALRVAPDNDALGRTDLALRGVWAEGYVAGRRSALASPTPAAPGAWGPKGDVATLLKVGDRARVSQRVGFWTGREVVIREVDPERTNPYGVHGSQFLFAAHELEPLTEPASPPTPPVSDAGEIDRLRDARADATAVLVDLGLPIGKAHRLIDALALLAKKEV